MHSIFNPGYYVTKNSTTKIPLCDTAFSFLIEFSVNIQYFFSVKFDKIIRHQSSLILHHGIRKFFQLFFYSVLIQRFFRNQMIQ